MKVYSDIFMAGDMHDAAHKIGVHIDFIERIPKARVRSRGWNIKLGNWSNRRHRNSGRYGAATWDTPAASFDEHGKWMAQLFDIDPNARIAYYDGRDDFHRSTKNQFVISKVES